MDWRRAGTALNITGLIGLVVGFIWRDTVNDDAQRCRFFREGNCPESAGPTIVLTIGLVALIVGVVLTVANRRDA
jgi:hypothetical protein